MPNKTMHHLAVCCRVSNIKSYGHSPTRSGNPACTHESGELLMNWIPVYAGNPGLGACPILDTGVKPDNDRLIETSQAL